MPRISFIMVFLGCLALTACQSTIPKKILTKGSRYVRDREKDYHQSFFVPTLKVPATLSSLDSTKEYNLPATELVNPSATKETKINICPPGLDL